MKAFYFATTDRKLRYDDNRPIVVGETHEVDCVPRICECGLHASERLIDALRYAPGPILYLVELSGEMDVGEDKIAAQQRTYLAEFDASELLRKFARRQALINIEKIKPYCNEEDYCLILKSLETGDASLMDAAMSVVWSAAWSAARSVARYAAWSVQSAAWSAARSAAWSVQSATGSVVWSAAWSAAKSSYGPVADSASLYAANEMLTQMIREEAGWDI